MIVRTFLLALALAVLPSLVHATPAAATTAIGQIVSVEGRVVQVSVASIGLVDSVNGRTVRFHLEPYFDEVFSAGGKTKVSMEAVHIGSIIKVFYDQRYGGTRRAERIEVLKGRPT
jgi:hypothetical protein